ncbi:triose-phosphate isomerase [Halobellus ruber]|uniref:Triosephosphate isomerase n=1 Tax=Halobellus ruber TaxID=2761102 RepID=A0A7J9SGJ4_9EURY|nr:triose-phosphate isomerase [Halobellus ruber]MBB6645106.1 triosephosphate isomerase [Halobellus ruber]
MTHDHAVPYPHFQVNCKIYPGTGGDDGLEFARIVERVQNDTDATFVFTPQLPDLRRIATETDLAVTTPAVDGVEPGRGIGKILPETIQAAGALGAVINHAEARDTLSAIERKIHRCREVGMDSIVCVDSVEMGRAVAAFDPDSLVFEKPADISTDRAITQTHPERVREFVRAIDEVNPRTAVLVGGGISTVDDVRKAFEQGADAAGAASAISLADDPEPRLRSIAEAFEDV